MRLGLLLVAAILVLPSSARAADKSDYAFAQHPGAAVPGSASFDEADGRRIRFGDLFGHRPVILALGYFHCPSLCSVVRDDMLEALSHAGIKAGADYDLAVVSIDPEETTADAAKAEADDADRYPIAAGREASSDRSQAPPAGWHFLVGEGPAVAAVASAVGFRSRYDVHLKQFLHPAGLVVLTSEGRVSRYVLGAGYHAGDLRAAVTEASAGGIAKAALPLLLICFHFDAATGRYSLAVMKVLRLAGFITIVVMGTVLVLAFRGERRKSAT